MTSIYQVLEGDVVIQEITASEEFMREAYPDGNYRLAPVASPIPETPVTAKRIITIRSFKQRFTQAERVAVRIASLDDPSKPMEERQVAAAMADWQDILNSVLFVDLDFSETVAALQQMETLGLLADGRASEILGAEIQPEELPDT
jgi:hypothetical protein